MADSDKGPVRYKIFIKLLSGKAISLLVKSSDTIEFVKAIIQIKVVIPIDELRLLFNGDYLENHRRLSDYNIKMDSTLFVTLDHHCRARRDSGKVQAKFKKSGDEKYFNSFYFVLQILTTLIFL